MDYLTKKMREYVKLVVKIWTLDSFLDLSLITSELKSVQPNNLFFNKIR